MTPASNRSVEILVVGAGPTGLGAAWALDRSGADRWELAEAGESFGGLAGSTRDENGFSWDFGGHVCFSHYDLFDEVMDAALGVEGWLRHRRNSAVRVDDAWVPYPIQLHTDRLPERARALIRQPHEPCDQVGTPANFAQWTTREFGPGLVEVFMRPYNEKVWATPLEELGWRWTGERVARTSTDDAGERRDGWGPNATFRYPARGGMGEPWRRIGKRLACRHSDRVTMSMRLVGLDVGKRQAVFADGTLIAYENLITTVPLTDLVAMSTAPHDVHRAASLLRHTTVDLIGLGVRGEPPPAARDRTWLYFPDPRIPFYRVTVLSNYSPDNVPGGGHWSLLVEAASSGARPRRRPSLGCVRSCLAQAELLQSDAQIVDIWRRVLARGYPVPTVDRDRVLDRLRAYLEPNGVRARGRFGAWRYEVSNQDHSFMQGVEAVCSILEGTPETTVNNRVPPR